MRTSSIVSSAVIALTVVGASAATVPGSNGKLAYFYGAEIFTVQSNGKELRSLGAGLSPAWSPNGRRLAFDASRNRNYDVLTMRADGRDRRRVTRDPAPDYFASWSPDGTELVFTSDRGAGEDLYVVRADGTGERRLTTDPAPDWGAAWSPDGSQIAFAGNARGNLEVEVVTPDGGDRVALTNDPARDYDPAWSPDGRRIAFTSERDGNANVYLMNSDGSDVVRLTDDPEGDYRPAWSPDGRLIAFESERDPAVFDRDIYVMNADGSGQHRLRTGDANARDVDWQPTIDLALGLRRAPQGSIAVVTNISPAAEREVRVTAIASRRRIVVRIGNLPAGERRAVQVRTPQSARIVATVSGWHADANTRNNRAVLARP
jgi:Tol biopolymer transport system component